MKLLLSFIAGMAIGGLCVFYWIPTTNQDQARMTEVSTSLVGDVPPIKSETIHVVIDPRSRHTKSIPWQKGMTLLDAIASSGGTSDRIKEIRVFREGTQTIFTLKNSEEAEPELQPGDVVIAL